jgi:hypothetical protein
MREVGSAPTGTFGTEALARLGLRLGGFPVMLQLSLSYGDA